MSVAQITYFYERGIINSLILLTTDIKMIARALIIAYHFTFYYPIVFAGYIFDFEMSRTNFGSAVLICTRSIDFKSMLHLKYCISNIKLKNKNF